MNPLAPSPMPSSTSPSHAGKVAAIVAAAGRSTRMGEPKQLLPWGNRTVLGTVAIHLAEAGACPVLCVVGHRAEEMVSALGDAPAQLLHNSDYLLGEMLSSYQVGVRHLQDAASPALGALLALGDQPHIPVEVIRQVIEQANSSPGQIVIPSYEMRRGHPFYLPARLWPELLALTHDDTLRTLLQRHQSAITYVNVTTDAILRDIDTPADYQALAAKDE
ncbi:MAG: nucleotidyltransferase family protein [Caldilineaceae bacterium]|nr:nucleotidyltransferase family protein [Caldilineaceae bacterium]